MRRPFFEREKKGREKYLLSSFFLSFRRLVISRSITIILHCILLINNTNKISLKKTKRFVFLFFDGCFFQFYRHRSII